MKRARDEMPEDDATELVHLLPEIWVCHVFPATGQPLLTRALLAMTCREFRQLWGNTTPPPLTRAKWVADLAVLAGPAWNACAEWALESLTISALSTFDALVAMDARELFLTAFLPRYRSLSAIYDLRSMPRTLEYPDVGLSPLDVAGKHGTTRILDYLYEGHYPRLLADATLIPCIKSRKLAVLEWISKRVGLHAFLGDDGRGAYDKFLRAIAEHGTAKMWDEIMVMFRYRRHDYNVTEEQMHSVVIGWAATVGNLEILTTSALLQYIGGENLLKSSLHGGNRFNAFEYMWRWSQAYPRVEIGQSELSNIGSIAIASGSLQAAIFVDANVVPLVSVHLQIALNWGRPEIAEWMLGNKPESWILFTAIHHARRIDPISIFWFIKRGIQFSFALLTDLIVLAGKQHDVAYPFEQWLADTLHDRFLKQCHGMNQEYGSEFYRRTADVPPERGWNWGRTHGLPFPTEIESWMRLPDVDPGCTRMIVEVFGALRDIDE